MHLDGTIHRIGDSICDSIKEKVEPKVSYDWSKLDVGWSFTQGYIRKDDLCYHVDYGTVCYAMGAQLNKQDAVFEFHKAAREQVAKCRVSWADEVVIAAKAVGQAVKHPDEWNAKCPGDWVDILIGDPSGNHVKLIARHDRTLRIHNASYHVESWRTALKFIDALTAKGWTERR